VEIKEKKLLGLPSWGLALLTAFVSIILLFLLSSLLGSILPFDKNVGEGIGYIFYGIIVAIACFFICKHDPKSVWYVPIIANIPGIFSAIVESNFWITDLWIFICSGWILSIIASFIGRTVGQRSVQRN
jgi:hypothetical protein